jgi:Ca2+-binding RTX toxin-like protein
MTTRNGRRTKMLNTMATKVVRIAGGTALALSTAAVLLSLVAGVALGQAQTQAVPVECSGGACLGTGDSDLMVGSPGRDVVFAKAGDDFVFLYEGGGRDKAYGQGGDDYVDVQDGQGNDRVDCGRGSEDVAVFDKGDSVVRCEFTLGEGGERVAIG